MWFSIETSSRHVSLALGEGDACLREVARGGNASLLVEPLFRELDVDFSKLDLCVIGQGPGSYNGMRVGYAFLKGMICLHPLPVVQIPTPLTLALQAQAIMKNSGTASFLILNNARREEIYAALVELSDGKPSLQWDFIGSEASVRERLPVHLDAIVSSDYTAADLPTFSAHRWLSIFPSAAVTGQLAGLLNAPASSDLSRLEPRYVRPPVPEKI